MEELKERLIDDIEKCLDDGRLEEAKTLAEILEILSSINNEVL